MLEAAKGGKESPLAEEFRAFGRAVADGRGAAAYRHLLSVTDKRRAVDACGVAGAFMFFTRVVDAEGHRHSPADQARLAKRVAATHGEACNDDGAGSSFASNIPTWLMGGAAACVGVAMIYFMMRR
mmetsp:Transcript_1383/g.2403  ORF Transcript_1383/g.2403 Transcript_1383/m.2403 type:complete len:126 (-) Transcript_1383:52-429(-)|eukprot:CAMPEP_0168582810 /NCGR_PEP_ID=MMETSP0420-20121227/2193_1 /TAXON_ID=498008 /ORGANISM="Pessonella sp." /LENGTH=125 /DNA_ID=CAMNT_0008617347 /DNA_START=874 /DNA_END=1251 /DNA_ORIENTATION=+